MREKAWDDESVQKIGLKVVILEGFYTQEEIYNSEDVNAILDEIKTDI